MAENVLLEKQDISGFFYNTTFGAYAVVSNSTPFVLEANGEYIILWDDVEYTRTAFSFTAADGAACVGVGNPVAAGLEANEDTFAIVYDSTNSVLYYFSLVEGESHNVQVSQIVEDVEPEPDPDTGSDSTEEETPEGATVVLAKSELAFEYTSAFNTYAHVTYAMPFLLVVGHQYTIVWDSNKYIRTAFAFTAADGTKCIAVGNPSAAGESSNKDPFAVVCEITNDYVYYLSTEEKETHTVIIYLNEGIVLQDRNGNDVAYYGIETVTFDTTTEGKQQTYTKGVAVEDLEIVPDFSGGDVTVKAPDGTLVKSAVIKKPTVESLVVGESEGAIPLDFSSGESIEVTPSVESAFISELTIQKPEALVPENIAEGVNIAGVVGAFAGGGANVVFNRGSFSGLTDNPITIDHGLGVTPDIIVVSTNGFTSITTNYILYNFVGFSSALVQAMTDGNLDSGNGLSQVYTRAMYSTVYNTYKSYRVTGGEFFGTATAIDISEPTSMRFIYGANETSFKIINKAGQYGYIDSTLTYRWYAIGGLT